MSLAKTRDLTAEAMQDAVLNLALIQRVTDNALVEYVVRVNEDATDTVDTIRVLWVQCFLDRLRILAKQLNDPVYAGAFPLLK